MKTIKKLSKYLIILFVIIGGACTDLETQLSGVIDPNSFPKTEDDVKALAISCYVPFSSNRYNGIFTVSQKGYQIVGDVTTDLGNCRWNGWNAIIYQNWNADTEVITYFYNYVRDYNKFTYILSMIENTDINENVKKRAIAEVKCARGFMGYLLYSWFGPFSVATIDQLQDPLSNEVVPRPTDEQMVAIIEKDLKEAAVDLNYKYSGSEFGRFTKGVCNTLLLKLYMLDQQWDKATEIGRELKNPLYGYDLVRTSFADIFTFTNQQNSEIIFATVCNQKNAQLWLAHVLPNIYPTQNTRIVKWNGYKIPWEFMSTFETNDKRLSSIISTFKGTNGTTYTKTNPGNYLREGAIPMKYGEDPNALGEESSIDWIVFRYADVLTLLAEAIVRENNTVTQEALDLVNDVRGRAGLTAYTLARYSTGGATKFFEDVLLERGHELWFEGVRREDLIRHGKYKEAAIQKGSTTAQDWYVRMPLPQKVINEGKGQIKQNPEY